jgi:prophage regulatory protein
MSRSSIYSHIKSGLFPRPLAIGVRMVGFRQSEIAAVIAARIRGATDDELRLLISKLEADRKGAV